MKLFTSAFCFLFLGSSFSQNYDASYNFILAIKTDIMDTTTTSYTLDADTVDLNNNSRAVLVGTIEAHSSCRYAYFMVRVRKTNFDKMIDVNTADEYLIDYKKKIVYSVGSKTYSNCETEEVHDSDIPQKNGDTYTVIFKKGTNRATVEFDKKIPACLTGKLAVKNNKHGVSKIESNVQKITLLSFKPSDFYLKKEVKRIKKICRTKAQDMNNLFL